MKFVNVFLRANFPLYGIRIYQLVYNVAGHMTGDMITLTPQLIKQSLTHFTLFKLSVPLCMWSSILPGVPTRISRPDRRAASTGKQQSQ